VYSAKIIFIYVGISSIILLIIISAMSIFKIIGLGSMLLVSGMIAIVFLIFLGILIYLRNNYFKYCIKKHLTNYDFIKDDYIVEEIINDLDSAFYK